MSNKELGAIRVRPAISHAQYSRAVVPQLRMKFVGKPVPGSARARPRGVSALSHEVGDNPVKGHTVIESLPGEKDKIVHCSRNFIRVETNNNISDIGLQGCCVRFLGIDRHRRFLLPLLGHARLLSAPFDAK